MPDDRARDLLNNYVALTKMGLALNEVVLFGGKQLPPRAFNYHFKIEEVPLFGAAPQLPPGGLAGLAPVPVGYPVPLTTAGNEVEYFMPQAAPSGVLADEKSFWQFSRPAVTFVQEQQSQRPFVLVGASLQVSANAPSPTRVAMVWAADRLPDVADLAQADNAGSAAIFFSQQYPPCMFLHPHNQHMHTPHAPTLTTCAKAADILTCSPGAHRLAPGHVHRCAP